MSPFVCSRAGSCHTIVDNVFRQRNHAISLPYQQETTYALFYNVYGRKDWRAVVKSVMGTMVTYDGKMPQLDRCHMVSAIAGYSGP